MQLKMKNLGPLRQAEFEMGDLIVICGANNTTCRGRSQGCKPRRHHPGKQGFVGTRHAVPLPGQFAFRTGLPPPLMQCAPLPQAIRSLTFTETRYILINIYHTSKKEYTWKQQSYLPTVGVRLSACPRSSDSKAKKFL
ncbi:MAG: hypothetical protein D3924_13350 [Candidatus Electrothrix sp. AR4]|nr:hypothetical protein [Candidatus Electrothrix sp. AR4]